MTTAPLEVDPVDALRESVATADYARSTQARHVAAWTLTHHPDLGIAQQWRTLEDRYITLQREYMKAVSA